jgi:sugar lactone lactonase YvrE
MSISHRLAVRAALGVVAALASTAGASAQWSVSHFAGPRTGGPGVTDGVGAAAQFTQIAGASVDRRTGLVFVTDAHAIRTVAPNGLVTTIAGLVQSPGSGDGPRSLARFRGPAGVSIAADGALYIADTENSTIRRLGIDGYVTTIAGVAGSSGAVDGAGASARFSAPMGIVAGLSGRVYVADTGNHTIRVISPDGIVRTLGGVAGASGFVDGIGAAARFNRPRAVAADAQGLVYVADTDNGAVRTIDDEGRVTTLAGPRGPQFVSMDPFGVAVAPDGVVYVADVAHHVIQKIQPDGSIEVVAGRAGRQGGADGQDGYARFSWPTSLAIDADGVIHVTDAANLAVRAIGTDGSVTTVAGGQTRSGASDGAGTAARFWFPGDVAVDGAGVVFVADPNHHTIRRIDPTGFVTTIAGRAGQRGSADGIGAAARFDSPGGVATGPGGLVYVADSGNDTIRRIAPDGTVTTLAGQAGEHGYADGVGVAARFARPLGLAVDASGVIYVADRDNDRIRAVRDDGTVTTYAGDPSVGLFDRPSDVGVDADGIVYVADTGHHAIRTIARDGTVGYRVAAIGSPRFIAVEPGGLMYVADWVEHVIWRVRGDGIYTAVAGLRGSPGHADGVGDAARFNGPQGLAVLPETASTATMLFVADPWNAAIRVLSPSSDPDGDGLATDWELQFGLAPGSAATEDGADGDPDGDGLSNAEESAQGSHPRGFFTRYFAEGAQNSFFATRIALLNVGLFGASVSLRFDAPDGTSVYVSRALEAQRRATIDLGTVPDLPASFSTIVESDRPIVAERTMAWDRGGFGMHSETSLTAATSWYLAEGSTGGGFSLFYLLQNPGDRPASATVQYVRPGPAPAVERRYELAPRSRTTVFVDSQAPELSATDVSAVITATAPIVVERAMYLDRPWLPFAAGHVSAGVTAPALTWILVEGSTGPFFDEFIVIANPHPEAATVEIRYQRAGGAVTKTYAVAASATLKIHVNEEQIPAGSGSTPLASGSLSAIVRSLNGVSIVVERAMWWPRVDQTPFFWNESHHAAAADRTATAWAVADGESGGPALADTYLLVACPDQTPANVRVTFFFEDDPPTSPLLLQVHGRATFRPASLDSDHVYQTRFGALVESADASPAGIVVERAVYESPGGVLAASGAVALGTPIGPPR